MDRKDNDTVPGVMMIRVRGVECGYSSPDVLDGSLSMQIASASSPQRGVSAGIMLRIVRLSHGLRQI